MKYPYVFCPSFRFSYIIIPYQINVNHLSLFCRVASLAVGGRKESMNEIDYQLQHNRITCAWGYTVPTGNND